GSAEPGPAPRAAEVRPETARAVSDARRPDAARRYIGSDRNDARVRSSHAGARDLMELPATLGKYELLEFLGGGMSHVYRARDTVIDRAVVVKILTDESCKDADAKARFLQEAKLAGGFQHENIVSVFDYGEFDGKPFIVMEYLKGEDLRDAI